MLTIKVSGKKALLCEQKSYYFYAHDAAIA